MFGWNLLSYLSLFCSNLGSTKECFKYYGSSIVVHLFPISFFWIPIYQVIFIKINLKIASSKAFVIKMMHLCSFHKHILNLYAHFGAENKSDYVFCDTLLFFASTFSVPTPLILRFRKIIIKNQWTSILFIFMAKTVAMYLSPPNTPCQGHS